MNHLLSISDLDAEGLEEVFSVARAFAQLDDRPIRKVPTLRGKVVATVFFEDSTRTRFSFETAAKRLSADVLSFSVGSSSVKKGESLRDTIETIECMGIDALIIRHASSGAPLQVSRWVKQAKVINAGDGWHEHPTQALIDCYSVAERRPIAGANVVIVGDIRHSRVARSQVLAYHALGADVTLCAPGSLLPPSLDGWPVKVTSDLDGALNGADVVSLLRLQTERGAGSFVPSLREFRTGFGLTTERAARLSEHCLITHPGPMNRGVEIDSEVTALPNCLVTTQVRNGIAIRMAVLFLLLGATTESLAAIHEGEVSA